MCKNLLFFGENLLHNLYYVLYNFFKKSLIFYIID